MNYDEALSHARHGVRVCRVYWSPNQYVVAERGKYVVKGNGVTTEYAATAADKTAKDWIIWHA